MTIYLWTLIVDRDQLVKRKRKFYKHKYLLGIQLSNFSPSMERKIQNLLTLLKFSIWTRCIMWIVMSPRFPGWST